MSQIKCEGCRYFKEYLPKGGPILVDGGKVLNIGDPFVICKKINYYKTIPMVVECKDRINK